MQQLCANKLLLFSAYLSQPYFLPHCREDQQSEEVRWWQNRHSSNTEHPYHKLSENSAKYISKTVNLHNPTLNGRENSVGLGGCWFWYIK